MCVVCNKFNPFGGDWLHNDDIGLDATRTVTEGENGQGDAPTNTGTPYALEIGDSFNGSLAQAGDWDWIAVDVVAGTTYTLTMTPGTMADAYLEFYDENGDFIDFLDQGFDNEAESLTLTAQETTTFYVAAGSWYNTPEGIQFLEDNGITGVADTGTYTISLTEVAVEDLSPLDALEWGYVAPSVIDVYFVPGGVDVVEGGSFGSSYTASAWTQSEIDQAMLAFEQYENVANLTFNVTANAADAEFFMIESPEIPPYGYWWVGGNSIELDGTAYNPDGAGAFNSTDPTWSTAGLEQGGFGFITLIHEIGHGLGLAHPHDGGGASDIMLGVSSEFGDFGAFDLNQGIYTTMTYNDGWATAPHGTPPNNGGSFATYGWQATPMALDVALIQQLYGANMNHNTGNDTYVLPTNNAPGTFYSAIWDANGTDEIVHNGSEDAFIDLREAPISYAPNGGGYVSYVTGIHGGFTVAAGAAIENATGGLNDDTIIGNDLANVISGRTGEDSIDGGDGNDTLNGDGGFDTIHGGDGHDSIDGGFQADMLYGDGGNDTLIGGAGVDNLFGGDDDDRLIGGDRNDRLYGGDGRDFLFGNADADRLFGEDGNDRLFGGGGFDWLDGGRGADYLDGGLQADNLFGRGGNDTLMGGGGLDRLFGGDNDDELYGEDGNDGLFGEDGNDTLMGGEGTDRLFGGKGNDVIDGGADNDTINAGSGFDTITGGAGDDEIWGKFNADRFIFADGHGSDTIRDFAATNDIEKIDLSGITAFSGITDFNGLLAATVSGQQAISASGGDVLIKTGGGNEIWLSSVALIDLDDADFIFA
jgi:Ca2+-binding RTX toxin-like protein